MAWETWSWTVLALGCHEKGMIWRHSDTHKLCMSLTLGMTWESWDYQPMTSLDWWKLTNHRLLNRQPCSFEPGPHWRWWCKVMTPTGALTLSQVPGLLRCPETFHVQIVTKLTCDWSLGCFFCLFWQIGHYRTSGCTLHKIIGG